MPRDDSSKRVRRKPDWVEQMEADEREQAAREAAHRRAIAGPSRPRRATKTLGRHDAKAKYVSDALRAEVEAVARASKGTRENTLNTAAFNLGQFVGAGELSRAEVERELESACGANGYTKEHGANVMRRDIKHGLDDGIAKPRNMSDIGTQTAPEPNVVEVDDISGGQRKRRRVKRDEPQEDSDRKVHIKFLSGMKSRAPQWVWNFDGVGVVQLGRTILFAGSTGAGKSTATRWFAAQVSNGELPGAWHGVPMNVALFCGEEDTETQVMASLDAHEADRSRVATIFTTELDSIGGLHILQDEAALIEQLQDNEIRVLIVDPVMDTLSANSDPNSQLDVRRVLDAYNRIALAINGIVVGVAHLRKPNMSSGRVRDEITGSRAWVEKVRHTITFASQSGETKRLMQITKNSAGQEDLAWFYQLDEEEITDDDGLPYTTIRFEPGKRSPYTIDDLGSGGDDADLFEHYVHWLRMYLEDNGFQPSNKIKDAARKEMSLTTLHKARRKLKCEVRYRTEEGITNTYWGLPGTYWHE